MSNTAAKRQGGLRQLAQQLCPPVAWCGVRWIARQLRSMRTRLRNPATGSTGQDLDVYWEAEMAQLLETWGEDNVWKEIQLLMVNCHGRVLDVACGTGKTMEILNRFPVQIHGCDISDLLIGKAVQRGISKERLTVCDATRMPYADKAFDYAYSIGSLEHFTEEGIVQLLRECKRTVRKASFHMIPVSRSGKDEGWLKTYQSFHNNSVGWWMERYLSVYRTVYVLDSTWDDQMSVGKWFVCMHDEAI